MAASADSLVSATTSLYNGYNSNPPFMVCQQSDTVFAGCDASRYGQSATSYASNTWIYGSAGALTTFVYGNGLEAAAGASIQFSDELTVVGASGSGNLRVTFTGLEVSSGDVSNGYRPPAVGVALGSYATFPPLFGYRFQFGPQTTTLVLPITFGSATPFGVEFSNATNYRTFGGFTSSSAIYDSLQFPVFVVTDAQGAVLPGASVVFTPAIAAVPEPATWSFGLLALLLSPLVRLLLIRLAQVPLQSN